jgi:hypothetical protein
LANQATMRVCFDPTCRHSKARPHRAHHARVRPQGMGMLLSCRSQQRCPRLMPKQAAMSCCRFPRSGIPLTTAIFRSFMWASLSELELRSEQYGTIRAQSCVRGNVNPQISRLGNGPDRDPNPARRSLDLKRQSCPASCEERRGISQSAAVGARAGLPCSMPASFQFGCVHA